MESCFTNSTAPLFQYLGVMLLYYPCSPNLGLDYNMCPAPLPERYVAIIRPYLILVLLALFSLAASTCSFFLTLIISHSN